MRWLSAITVCCVLLLPLVAASQESPEGDPEIRAGAWVESVRLEAAGDVQGARALLIRAWGSSPEGYEVTVRLAWLSLLSGDSSSAIALYERAQSLDGAGPEATQGLASAHTLRGFNAFADGDRTGAREAFEQALTLDPSQGDARAGLALLGPSFRVAPDLWVSALSQSMGNDSWTGWGAFANADWRLSDRLSLRTAFRHVQLDTETSTTRGPGRGRSSSTSTTTSQQEAYLALGVSLPSVFAEIYGLGLSPTQGRPTGGGGARLRLGRRWGIAAEHVSISQLGGWSHQVTPSAFVWPLDWVGLSVGTRLTFDPVGSATSVTGGLSLLSSWADLYLAGHSGPERWAFRADALTLLNLAYDGTLGGTATLALHLGDEVSLMTQAEYEILENGNENGTYWNASLGIQYIPGNPPRR